MFFVSGMEVVAVLTARTMRNALTYISNFLHNLEKQKNNNEICKTILHTVEMECELFMSTRAIDRKSNEKP